MKFVNFLLTAVIVFGVVFGLVYLGDCFIHNKWWINPLDYLGKYHDYSVNYTHSIEYMERYEVNVEGRIFIYILTIVSLLLGCFAFSNDTNNENETASVPKN